MRKSTLGLLAGVLGSAFGLWVNHWIAHRRSSKALSGSTVPEPDYSRLADGVI